MVFQKVLWPTLVPDQTMEHIHERHEEHITRNEILEVMNRDPVDLEIKPAPSNAESDYEVRGSAVNGKRLHLCVILNKERIVELYEEWDLENEVSSPPFHYASIVYTGWWVGDE